jgi:hypothetical protein
MPLILALVRASRVSSSLAYYSCRSSGYIPRQIATEVLNSIQRTLFPSTTDAKILLRSLVAKHKLDPDCLTFEPSAYQLPGENTTEFRYLESRLVDLYEELDNPTPRGYLEKWLERRSGARYDGNTWRCSHRYSARRTGIGGFDLSGLGWMAAVAKSCRRLI